jgi:Phosphotransferase enzyme family
VGAAAEITGIQRLPGGASRESWGVQARLADGAEHRLILLRDPRIDALSQLTGLYEDFAEPRPALEIGLRWLAAHRPEGSADALVHGDFRTGNLIVGQDGLRGVLDWELAHRGDPMHDLGWLCTKAWRFGSANPVGGFGARADLMAGYAAGGGIPRTRPPSGGGSCTAPCGGLCCAAGRPRYLSDAEPSIELAVLGRRVCEQESRATTSVLRPPPGGRQNRLGPRRAAQPRVPPVAAADGGRHQRRLVRVPGRFPGHDRAGSRAPRHRRRRGLAGQRSDRRTETFPPQREREARQARIPWLARSQG